MVKKIVLCWSNYMQQIRCLGSRELPFLFLRGLGHLFLITFVKVLKFGWNMPSIPLVALVRKEELRKFAQYLREH